MSNILIDKEKPLWSLKGPGWSLPIIVEWPEANDMAAVHLCRDIPLLNIQIDAATKQLEKHGYWANGRIWILGYQLVRIASPAPTDDPEEVVEWTSKVGCAVNLEMTNDMKSFIDDFCHLGYTSNPEKTKILWVALCRHMLHWILIKNRSLDLGFVEIFAPPMRADWKNQFILKWVDQKKISLKKAFVNILHMPRSASKEFSSPEYLASMAKNTIVMRRVEVIHKRSWWKNVYRVEKTRTPKNYWNEIKTLMEHYGETQLRAISAYAHEALAPVPFIADKSVTSVEGVPAGWRPHKVNAVQITLGNQVRHIAVLDTTLKKNAEPFELEVKEEGVQRVRSLRS